MSNAGKPFVLQHAVPNGVVATRWWWVRHAPVREDGGCIYGQKDIAATQRSRGVRGGGENPAASCGVVCKQSEADASNRRGDLGCRISKTRHDAARGCIRRTASWRMAGIEPRRVLRQPGRSKSAATGSRRSTTRRRAARVFWISTTACVARSSGSPPSTPART